MPTREDLQILQAQDLELKVMLTKQRIREFVTNFSSQGVYISFSGGKDSTVLLHLVRSIYPNIEAVFVNTGRGMLSVVVDITHNVKPYRRAQNFSCVSRE